VKVTPTITPRARVAAVALCAAAWALGLALLGRWATDIGPWYAALEQPDWKPADRWFGVVWTTIYVLAAVAATKAYLALDSRRERTRLMVAIGLNGGLNVLWSWLFFQARRPDWALAEVVVLWLSIVLLLVLFARASPAAAWLLLPYLLWVSFAAVLNLAVVRLNAPF
jgi:benzodiazapine receptor